MEWVYKTPRRDPRWIDLKRKKFRSIKDDEEMERGESLWFSQQEESVRQICHNLYQKDKRCVLVVAQPGVGKTNLIHNLYYNMRAIVSDENVLTGDNITIATGMSSVDWKRQTKKGLSLLESSRSWKEDVYHRDDLKGRVDVILKNPDCLSNHLFIIDECHIANDIETTLDKLFDERLKLTEEVIIRLKIKFVFISATPDLLLVELLRKNEEMWSKVTLEPGPFYRGFDYFLNKRRWIRDYYPWLEEVRENFRDWIHRTYSTPRVHIFRCRTQGDQGKVLREILMESCRSTGWKLEEHVGGNKLDLDGILSRQPTTHTFIMIKGLLTASKRLRVSRYLGLVVEPPARREDVTVQAQGLIPRFFQYYSEAEMQFLEPPRFILSEDCVKSYLQFVENWSFQGTGYQSSRINKEGEARGGRSTFVNSHLKDEEVEIIAGNPYYVEFKEESQVPETRWSRDTPGMIMEDDSGHPIPSGIPEGCRSKFKLIDGYWRHCDGKIRRFGDNPPGGGGNGSVQYVLLYKNDDTRRYIIMKTKFN